MSHSNVRLAWSVIFLSCTIAIGCSKVSNEADRSHSQNSALMPVDAEKTCEEIEDAAIAELSKRTSVNKEMLRIESRYEANEWRVMVTFLPETPGGHCELIMSNTGKLKEFISGE
jgi:hypothetical protein